MLELIRNVRFTHKLVLLIMLQAIPLGFAVYGLNARLGQSAQGTERAVAGLNYAEPLADLASAVSEHRIVATARLAGSDALRAHGEAMRAEGEAMMKEIAAQQALHGAELGVGGEHAALVEAWNALMKARDADDATVVEQVHADTLLAASRLRVLVERRSGLAMDPETVTASLIGIAVSAVSDLFSAGGGLAASMELLRREGADSYKARRILSAEEGQVREELDRIDGYLKEAVAADPALTGKFDAGFETMRAKWTTLLQAIQPLVTQDTVSTAELTAFSEQLLEAFRSVHEIHDPISDELRAYLAARTENQRRDRMVLLGVTFLAFTLVILVSWWMGRQLSGGIAQAGRALSAISRGDLDTEIDVRSRDEVGTMLSEMASMRDRLRSQLVAERAQAAENLRIRQALDSSSASVMIADTSGSIVFVNRSASALFTEMEPAIRRALPNFQANRIVGSSFDIFHAKPSHQRGLLQALQSGHTSRIPLGDRQMQISAYPVRDGSGASIGYAVEWIDRTTEAQAEKEIATVVGAAVDGDLTPRLVVDGKPGFLAALSRQVNSLLDTNQSIFDDLARVFAALAKGRLTESIATEYRGTYGRIRDDVNATIKKLVGVVEHIQMSSDVVNASAMQLARGNDNLSQRTTQQAASLEETAASIEELTSTVRNNAENSGQANQLATETRAVAEKGGEVVSRAVAAMREINESSRQIADIIGVIDEIAFQTNLLALNAAVEAARAGEQGRGFAVVAAEVRTLAKRSAESARAIKQLIQDSVTKVDNGSQLVDESGRTLEEIVGSVKRVSDLVAEITAASREQATGVDEINKAVSQMDQSTTQNAALVDEAASGTQALAEQARSLAEVVAFFDVGSARRSAAPETAARGGKPRHAAAERAAAAVG